MKTNILNGNLLKNINYAIELLNNDQIVALPTETVYGLGANAYSRDAIEKIFIVKNRPKDNPLIIHVHNIKAVSEIVEDLPNDAIKLFKIFSPGPLTIILKKNDKISNWFSNGLNSIGIRIPGHHVILNLLKIFNKPIAAPSANISGFPSPTTAYHVLNDLNKKISLILDGGRCRIGIESTVISFIHKTPVIIRPGYISKNDIENVLNYKIQIYNENIHQNKILFSPGLKYRHYSPNLPLKLYIGHQNKISEFILKTTNNKNEAIITFDEYLKNYIQYKKVFSLGPENSYINHSKNLFNILRNLDKTSNIVMAHIHCPKFCDKSIGIINRLIKSVGNNIEYIK